MNIESEVNAMRVDEENEVIIFDEEEIKAIDKIRDMVLEIGLDLRCDVRFSIMDGLGELWEMRRMELDRIPLE